MAHLAEPCAGFECIVLAGAHGSALAFTPGHFDDTALPAEAGSPGSRARAGSVVAPS